MRSLSCKQSIDTQKTYFHVNNCKILSFVPNFHNNISPAVTICGESIGKNKITGKVLDQETGLYYYGARYLDPKTSRWISGDPAMADYIPSAPVDDDARNRNQNLPGQGGVFNYVNLHTFAYAGNNPVKYTDPDGEETIVVYINNPKAVWNGIAGGAHVAVIFTDPGVNSSGRYQDPAIYDPSGSFKPDKRGRPVDAIFTATPENIDAFIKYHFGEGASEILLYKLDTNLRQEASMLGRAEKQGERYLLFPMSCAKDVSEALELIGVKKVSTPGELRKQMEALVEAGKAEKTVLKNPNADTP